MRVTTKNTKYTKKSFVIASRPDRAAVRVICAIRGSVFFHFTTHAARGKARHEGNHEKHELHEKKFCYCFAAQGAAVRVIRDIRGSVFFHFTPHAARQSKA
jgi:hypothetical protein